jgi:hypothetical protein
VVAAAVTLLQHWGTLEGGLKLASPPKAAAKSAALPALPQRPETFPKRKHQTPKQRCPSDPCTLDMS